MIAAYREVGTESGSSTLSGRCDWVGIQRPGVFARQFRCGFGFVIPAKAGIQKQRDKHTVWMPACAGMTFAGWFEIELAGKAGPGVPPGPH